MMIDTEKWYNTSFLDDSIRSVFLHFTISCIDRSRYLRASFSCTGTVVDAVASELFVMISGALSVLLRLMLSTFTTGLCPIPSIPPSRSLNPNIRPTKPPGFGMGHSLSGFSLNMTSALSIEMPGLSPSTAVAHFLLLLLRGRGFRESSGESVY